MKEKSNDKTKQILEEFARISEIPRCSKHEEKIGAFLLQWAEEHRFSARKDSVGNVVIRVPATPGYEEGETVVIQGHVDMVCEKTPDSPHDFSKDPIELVYEGDWLKANQTTLGADNGIALAIAMTLALDKNVEHPPLELLFTVDEETGLSGVNSLGSDFISGKILLNVDSEDEGVFTVGCAGGRDTRISLPLEYVETDGHYVPLRIKVSNMTGGHSGVNIHEERGNAIILLVRALHQINRSHDIRLSFIGGGTAHNAIPRDAEAILFLLPHNVPAVEKLVPELDEMFRNEFRNTDPNLTLTLGRVENVKDIRAMTAKSTARVIDLLLALPHGVAAMSTDMKGLVETSNNLANVKVEEGMLKIVTSQRSSVMSKLHAITRKIEVIASLAGAVARSNVGYPSWQPNLASPLLARCKKVYRKLFKKLPHVETIHAGLECGIIGDKYPGMDMISLGPTLKNPHSPDERIHIPSIGKIWDFLVELLSSLK
jgi:dipeptidase D